MARRSRRLPRTMKNVKSTARIDSTLVVKEVVAVVVVVTDEVAVVVVVQNVSSTAGSHFRKRDPCITL